MIWIHERNHTANRHISRSLSEILCERQGTDSAAFLITHVETRMRRPPDAGIRPATPESVLSAFGVGSNVQRCQS
jgi:hypothetical protein